MDTSVVIVLQILFVLGYSVALQDSCHICQCKTKMSSVCGLENRIAWLERNMMAVDGKIAEWVKQQYHIRSLEAQIIMQKQEINELMKRVDNFQEQSELSVPLNVLNKNTDDTSNATIPSVLKSDINELSQNLSLFDQRMDDMESKTIKNLTLEVIELKEELKEKELHGVIKTGFIETELMKGFNNLSAECKGIQQKLSTMEMSIVDQERKYDNGLESIQKRLAAVETISSFSDGWQKSLNAVEEGLDRDQMDIQNLAEELSTKKAAWQKLENTLMHEQQKLEQLSKDVTSLQETVHVQDTKFRDELSLMMDNIKQLNEQQKNKIKSLQDYFNSTINDYMKNNFATSSFNVPQGNGYNVMNTARQGNVYNARNTVRQGNAYNTMNTMGQHNGYNGSNLFIRVGKNNFGPGYNEGNIDQNGFNCRSGCLPLDLSRSQYLTFESPLLNKSCYEVGDTLQFKCKDQLILHDPTTTTCLIDGKWSSSSLPSCVIPMGKKEREEERNKKTKEREEERKEREEERKEREDERKKKREERWRERKNRRL